jgi:hypothetical protein
MLPTHLLALALYFPLFSVIFASADDTFLAPPIGGRTEKSTGDNAQLVLEHSPVTDTDCRLPVRLYFALHPKHYSYSLRRLATWPDRGHSLQLRNRRKRQ